jgi:DNA-directed RNA polymerase specialized sigma24 family protein
MGSSISFLAGLVALDEYAREQEEEELEQEKQRLVREFDDILEEYLSKYGKPVIKQFLRYKGIDIGDLVQMSSGEVHRGVSQMLEEQEREKIKKEEEEFKQKLKEGFEEITKNYERQSNFFKKFRNGLIEHTMKLPCSEEEREMYLRDLRDDF